MSAKDRTLHGGQYSSDREAVDPAGALATAVHHVTVAFVFVARTRCDAEI